MSLQKQSNKEYKTPTDDAGLSPASMGALEGGAHHLHVAGGVEGVVHTPTETETTKDRGLILLKGEMRWTGVETGYL